MPLFGRPGLFRLRHFVLLLLLVQVCSPRLLSARKSFGQWLLATNVLLKHECFAWLGQQKSRFVPIKGREVLDTNRRGFLTHCEHTCLEPLDFEHAPTSEALVADVQAVK